jgi:hypothetical protein
MACRDRKAVIAVEQSFTLRARVLADSNHSWLTALDRLNPRPISVIERSFEKPDFLDDAFQSLAIQLVHCQG